MGTPHHGAPLALLRLFQPSTFGAFLRGATPLSPIWLLLLWLGRLIVRYASLYS